MRGVLIQRKVGMFMYLRSFSYSKQLTGEMLDVLFKDLEDDNGNLEDNLKNFDYGFELIESALDGRIYLDKPFHLHGWVTAFKNGKYQEEIDKLKRRQYFTDDYEDSTGVKLSSIADMRDDYEDILDKEELAYTVNEVCNLNNEFKADMGIDFIFCMRRAVQGIPFAVEEIMKICAEYKRVAEYVKVILSSRVEFQTLFPEQIAC